ncbi:unnamed protein product [Arabis nemorensis]|uniref:Uncharacterized protein n=1 Tax=Arabis nemorensis TaxID=586526 RepID=A0A565CAD6_9BRAS|nr:unnamed protein product [Arabis nemorensis]
MDIRRGKFAIKDVSWNNGLSLISWLYHTDEVLCKAVEHFQGKNWKKIAECFKDRTDVQCLHRWQNVLNPELVKGPWSKEVNF